MLGRFMPIRLLVSAFLFLALHTTAFAETPTQKQLQNWADGFSEALKKAGAKTVSHGAVAADSSGNFTLNDIKVEFPESFYTEHETTTETTEKTNEKETRKSVVVKEARKTDTFVLTIAKINGTALQAAGDMWEVTELDLNDLRLALNGKTEAFVAPKVALQTLNAPKLDSTAFGLSPFEQIITLVQKTSFKSAIVTEAEVKDTALKSNDVLGFGTLS